MKKILFLMWVVFTTQTSSAQKAFGYDIPKKIDFSILSGTWKMKKSRDLKLFTWYTDSLKLNDIVGYGYLNSKWTFATDTTGYVVVPKSKYVMEEKRIDYKYKLIETQTGFGPSYKLDVLFANGFKTLMYVGSWDGKKSLVLG
jgi:hypothetical protein